MPEFLTLKPPFIALDELLSNLPDLLPESEEINTMDSLGRVLSNDFYSPNPLPEFPRSTVDGYAVRSIDTHGSSDSIPAILKMVGECPMGKKPEMNLDSGQAILIHTGGMIPSGADSVVMLENSHLNPGNDLEVYKAVSQNEDVILMGEDVIKGELVIPTGRILRAVEIGGLMSFGYTRILVNKKPVVGILSSGDEVIPPDRKPEIGQVRDINTATMSTLVFESGGIPLAYPIVPDREELLTQAVISAYNQCDMVLITAGSSASTRDLTSLAISKLGKPGVLAHGVNVKPGKPTILAVCNGKPVIGLPGNPVSALVIADIFVRPVIRKLLGVSNKFFKPAIAAKLGANVASAAGREDWVPVELISDGPDTIANPIFYKSNLIFNLVKANALLHITADVTGIQAGESVMVSLL
jgi:molybdopterin molybdotransferase